MQGRNSPAGPGDGGQEQPQAMEKGKWVVVQVIESVELRPQMLPHSETIYYIGKVLFKCKLTIN